MCNCINSVQDMLTSKMIELNPGAEIVERVELENVSIMLDSGDKLPFNPALGKYKKGNKNQKFTMSVIYTFCPFCGEKYKKEEGEK